MTLESLRIVAVLSFGLAASALALASGSGSGSAAVAAEPAAEFFVRTQIAELAAVLASGKPERFDVLRARMRAVADFDGFAKQALGKAWQKLSAEQQRRFTSALQGLLESYYMNKPGAIFDKEKVVVKEAKVAGRGVLVSAAIKQKDVDVGLVIKLHQGPTSWLVEDVAIDGLSMLEDYRAQFQSYLKKKSVDELTSRLASKAAANLAK